MISRANEQQVGGAAADPSYLDGRSNLPNYMGILKINPQGIFNFFVLQNWKINRWKPKSWRIGSDGFPFQLGDF